MDGVNGTIAPDHGGTHLNPSTPFWQGEASRVVQMVATLIIFLVGVPLNGIVIWALGWRARGRLHRRGSGGETRGANSFRVYVINLALADLVLLFRTPLMLGYLAKGYSWPFGDTMCRVIIFLRGLGLYSGAFLLCAVAVERCLCLLRPLWARLRRPAWTVPLTCTLFWVVASALAAPYLESATLKEKNGTKQCLESGKSRPGLFYTEVVAGFALPLLVFMGSNTAVLLTVRHVAPSTPTSSSRRLVRLYQVLFLTMLLFLTCWVPYFVCRFLAALTADKTGQEHLHDSAVEGKYISLYLVYTKSALNPVLYVFASRGLGQAIRASLVSTLERVFNDDSFESIRKKSLKPASSHLVSRDKADCANT